MNKFIQAVKDFLNGFSQFNLWGYWGWNDIRMRYRLSTLGPFWLTMSMAIFSLALGLVYSRLFKMNINEYLPYLITGFIIWTFISMVVNEAVSVFIEAGPYIKDMNLPLSIFICRMIWKNIIILLHNFLVYIAMLIYFQLNPGFTVWLVIPGLFITFLNALWVSLVLGIVGARYRDLGPIVTNIMQALFFISPITWQPQLIGVDSVLLKYNIINYFLDLLRSPLLGKVPSFDTWEVVIATTLIGWFLALLLFTANRKKIIFWV